MVIVHVEFVSFHKLGAEIPWIRGCLAHRQEEPPLASLAAICHLEENASHHIVFEKSQGASRDI